ELVAHHREPAEPEVEQQGQGRQAHRELGRSGSRVAPDPRRAWHHRPRGRPPDHCSARCTIDASAACTASEVRTLSSTPANATAASVPTAYSTVVMPDSGPPILPLIIEIALRICRYLPF